MIKKLFLITIALAVSFSSWGQSSESNLPQKGDFTVSATLGYNSFVSQEAIRYNSYEYYIAAMDTDWFDEDMLVGIEGNWFFADKWSMRLGGGFAYTYKPGYPELPGTYDNDSELGDGSIPTYEAVANESAIRFNVITGVDRHFNFAKAKNLDFHAGLHVGYAYSLHTLFYDHEMAMGQSIGEGFNLRGMVNIGLDYYFMPNMFAGIEVNALQYTYSYSALRPEEGLGNLAADSHNASFMAAPTIKIGFKF